MHERTSPPPRPSHGVCRRGFLKVGCLGWGGLSLSDLLRARACAEGLGREPSADRSIILIWLDGGPPQHETYDPKPDATAEFRGPFQATPPAVPGVRDSDLLT